MLSTKLINRADVSLYKQISQTSYDAVFDALVLETQIQDIAPLLGEDLFNSILKNPTPYADLLNGGEYTVSGNTYMNYGLKVVIAYYFYARYQMFGGITDTPFSMVEKLNGAESRPISEKSKKDLYNLNRHSAFTVWKSVENYLIRKQIPLFNSNSICSVKNQSFKFTKIG